MRHFPTLLLHELRMLAVAPATYVAGVLFLAVMGMFYFFVLFFYDNAPQTELPSTLYFQLFWMPVFFMVPLLTMKSVAEERRHGTLEATLTTPVSALEIVLAKFFAVYFLYLLLWAGTLVFPFLANSYLPIGRTDPRLVDPASLLGGYLFVVVSGPLYVSLGVFASSLTRSTLVAGMLAFCLLFILIVSGGLLLRLPMPESSWANWMQPMLDYLQTFRQLEDFTRGVVDTRPFFLYASNTILVLGVTTLVVEARASA
jgi:ABC-2 type transport system permease protein